MPLYSERGEGLLASFKGFDGDSNNSSYYTAHKKHRFKYLKGTKGAPLFIVTELLEELMSKSQNPSHMQLLSESVAPWI